MRNRSLLGITLELLREVASPGPYPADARVGRFFRERRYLGSRDRRFIGDATFAWLRHHHRARARWRIWARADRAEDRVDDAATGPGSANPAALSASPAALSASSVPIDRIDDTHLLDLLAIAADGHFPWPLRVTVETVVELLDDPERPPHDLVRRATQGGFPGDDAWPADATERFAAHASLPLWIGRRTLEQYGEERGRRLADAFGQPAPVDLRVNLRRATLEQARKSLCEQTGLAFEPTSYSPLGLRAPRRQNLTGTTASRRGWIEVQDEGSQLAILCADAGAGMTVIDACAGSGGKTLALADIVLRAEEDTAHVTGAHKSRVVACNIETTKLHELRRRARDARLGDRIEYVRVGEDGDLAGFLPSAHLVFVDAPCSGLGTIRRNPELKMRWVETDLARFGALQRSILARFAPLVRPGGRLVYVTCSFLREECEDVAGAFEAAHPEFEPSPSYWASTRLPPIAIDGHRIRLDPLATETDAFFIASWRRSKATELDADSGGPGDTLRRA